MLQIKLINVYGSHSQLTLLASLINNSCYSQTAVQFIISKKKSVTIVSLIMIRDFGVAAVNNGGNSKLLPTCIMTTLTKRHPTET